MYSASDLHSFGRIRSPVITFVVTDAFRSEWR
jgi:hypothetical protein